MLPLTPYLRLPLLTLLEDRPSLDALPDAFRCLMLDAAMLRTPTGQTSTAPKGAARAAAEGMPLGTLVIHPFLHGRAFTIGRKTTNDIVILDKRVSGVHASIEAGVGVSCRLSDMGSSNGTFVGARCLAPGVGGQVNINPGDVFLLADLAITLLDREGLRALRLSTMAPLR